MGYTAAVITVSDMGSKGLRQDTSGPAVCAMLEEAGFTVVHTATVPDEKEQISALLRECADEKKIDLVVTTGGTGLSPAAKIAYGDNGCGVAHSFSSCFRYPNAVEIITAAARAW